jgi:putative FmdB family regulatory protein
MPIYEYECLKCKNEFEYLIIHSSPEPECPKCGSKNLQKMISQCAVSSENTREANFQAARKVATKIGKEKQYEDHKASHHHDD